ncbi:MAG: MBOAT family O-acyltransferase, partial [Geminicoccaceae bacterium]
LALLGYFKYTDFLIANVNELLGTSLPILGIVLPIGISFYTFQQIAFLVDAYRGQVTDFTFKRYLFFITFFPQLIAGPIVHHAEILPQLAKRWRIDLTSDLALGLFIFLIGLTKKALLADSFAGIATPIFDSADGGAVLTAQEAWVGALAYTFQIYFDFSGYSDMAIGIARMFGLRLPINFASPYKSVGIIEFWRRWHITLSRFLRDYLYIPLGGNRSGRVRRYLNLLITMLLGGIWHGAGWGFVIWGFLHGAFLMIEHGFRALFAKTPVPLPRPLLRGLGWGLTFLAVILAWVPFRAVTLDGVTGMWGAMAGLSVGTEILTLEDEFFAWIAAGLVLVTLLPNSQEIVERLFGYRIGTSMPARRPAVAKDSSLEGQDVPAGTIATPGGAAELAAPGALRLALQVGLAACLGFAAIAGIALNNQITEFIYFQF